MPKPRTSSTKRDNTPTRVILETFVAGFIHGDWDVNEIIPKGSRLTLKREAINQYDKYALMLLHEDIKVGYLPREDRGSDIKGYNPVWQAIKAKVPVRITVMNHARNNQSHRALKIRVEVPADADMTGEVIQSF